MRDEVALNLDARSGLVGLHGGGADRELGDRRRLVTRDVYAFGCEVRRRGEADDNLVSGRTRRQEAERREAAADLVSTHTRGRQAASGAAAAPSGRRGAAAAGGRGAAGGRAAAVGGRGAAAGGRARPARARRSRRIGGLAPVNNGGGSNQSS